MTSRNEVQGTTRLASLDYLRGLTVIGMILVNASAALDAAGEKVFPVLLHAKWAGFTAADLVFPAFITMVGISIVAANRPGRPPDPKRIFWRTFRLILLGLLLVNMYLPLAPDMLWPPRLPGVLQRIAIVYAIVVLLYPRTNTRSRSIGAAAILFGYWLMCLMPLPDGLPVDLYAQGHNFASWVDRQVFGDWMGVKGPEGYDPEGLASTIPAVAQGLIGTVAGDLLLREGSMADRAKKIAQIGVAGIVLGIAWNPIFPIAKPIWTSSFVLLTAGITLVALAAFHVIFDREDASMKKGGLMGSFGRNAVTAYALHLLIIQLVMTSFMRAPIAKLSPIVGPEWAALVPVAIFMAIIWLPVGIMDFKGKYLKI